MTSTDSPTSAVERRLLDLGITLPDVVQPLASYVPAVVTGSYVFTAGQLPLINGELPALGKVGAEVTPEAAKEYAATCAVNALAAIKSQIGDLDRISRIVKVVGFVASDPGFTGQPEVINGASDLLGQVLADAGTHARSAVGVAVLPRDAPVEVEIIAEFV
ncbi:RidA family protein [Arthrobacter sp. H20]|uniref:RidA family protein n=1 Tax=Arthrobacter sp. H20 TaxID=1267981 RepID=UPI00047E7C04|nr:RidA family protein [Arthrobacter sp. H20]